jgi:hypothetical protein
LILGLVCGKWNQRARTAQCSEVELQHERLFFVGLQACFLGTEVANSREFDAKGSNSGVKAFKHAEGVVMENQLPKAQPPRADEPASDQQLSAPERFLVWLFLLVFLAIAFVLFADLLMAILR